MDYSAKIVHLTSDYILCWKQPGLSSSWGQEKCFLDTIEQILYDKAKKEFQDIWKKQERIFGREEEYGMLNRLDKVTSGLVYFARSQQAKEHYKSLQQQDKIQKIYYAQVYGTPRASFGKISNPIYHHKQDNRMTTDYSKSRGKAITKTTNWIKTTNPNRLRITITSGARHQIRTHLASIGHPIIDDNLYMTKKQKNKQRKRILKNNSETAFSDNNSIQLVSAGIIFHS